MEDEAVGIEALWKQFSAAQSGRWFLLKWMIVVGAADGICTGIYFAFQRVATGTFATAMLLTVIYNAVGRGAEGWILFRWGWRLWTWPATAVLTALGAFAGSYFARGPTVGMWTFLPQTVCAVLQMLLIRGVRRRYGLWLPVFAVNYGVSMSADFCLAFASTSVASLASKVGFPAWLHPYMIVFGAMGSLNIATTGAALAWLMPPVERAGDCVDSPRADR